MVPNAFIFVEFYGSEQFSDQNPQNFGARGKVLPVRDQKRSGRENHVILESTTETCSKHDFSMIFVGYSSRIFSDFDGFPQLSQFLHTVLTASRRRIGSKCVHFHGSIWMDPSIFRIKIRKNSALGAKCYRNVTKSVPGVEIT